MYDEDAEIYVATLVADRNYKDAYHLLLPLSEGGSVYASMVLGWIYENGAVGDKDIEKAKYFYQRAALGGDAEAYLRLGVMLLDKNRQLEARTAFESGSISGNLGSMYHLGIILLEDNSKDINHKGLNLISEAASRGHIFSQRKLLSLEISQSKSFFQKAMLIPKILTLSFKAFKEALRDINSELVL